MLSPSDCHPAAPASPYVAGGPVGPDRKLKVMELLEHSVLDHADPAGQHTIIQEVLEPLEHSVLDTAPGGQPVEDVGLGTVSAFGSECSPGRSTYGGDTGSGTVRAFGSGDGPGQWTHGGDITFRTVRAFGSECSLGRSTYGGDPSSGIVRERPLDFQGGGGGPGFFSLARIFISVTFRAKIFFFKLS